MKTTITQHLKNKKFYLIGIGGAGMMGIAELLYNLGCTVRGSDIIDSPSIKRLRKLKIKVFIGHDVKHLTPDDIIIYSNAIKKNNTELKFAQSKNMTVLSRMEILSELMRLKYGISVTGSHGKTTTTSLLSHILYKNKLDPTYLIGGKLKTDDPHVKLGNSNYIITETDESDPRFIILKPHLVVLTNLDKEHLENYQNSYKNLESSMTKFINSIPFYETVFINGDDKKSVKLLKSINRKIFTYGFKAHNQLHANNVTYSKEIMKFDLNYNNKSYSVSTKLLGQHNVYNILAAISVCIHLEIDLERIVQSVSNFYGASRRFDIYKARVNKKETTIIDDYGHHPTEISCTIQTIKDIFPSKKIIMVFQPHRYSRTKATWKSLVSALKGVNRVILLPTYSAGEKKNMYDSNYLNKKLKNKNKVLLRSLNNILNVISKNIDEESILLLQGAGDIKNIINLIKAK
tara:strand:- start:7034 stop:8413 length:1380 start_codon:yes stop_codon:yes gene_type:complete